MSYESLSPDEREIAIAVQHIRNNYQYKYSQLQEALGRKPTSAEMMEVAGREIRLLSRLDDLVRTNWHRIRYHIPNSLLAQVWLRDLRRIVSETS